MTCSIEINFEEPYRREPVWPELEAIARRGDLYHIREGAIQISGLEDGMASGRSSLAIKIDLPDGKAVLIETSYRLFKIAAEVLYEKFGEELDYE